MSTPIAPNPPPIYILSGGTGASGEQLVHTLLTQFPGKTVPVITLGHIRELTQIEDALNNAKSSGGLIVHTLVDLHLRQRLIDLARQHGVIAINLAGDVLAWLMNVLGCQPLGQPGLYRQLNQITSRASRRLSSP